MHVFMCCSSKNGCIDVYILDCHLNASKFEILRGSFFYQKVLVCVEKFKKSEYFTFLGLSLDQDKLEQVMVIKKNNNIFWSWFVCVLLCMEKC